MKGAIRIQEAVSLVAFNTLGIDVRARYFTQVHDLAQLKQALAWAREHDLDTLILGGGSNLVFAADIDALVIQIAIAGRRWADVDGDAATLVLGAGERWHDAVIYAASAGYRGIENLALIPGTAGAAPVQNIGAYGVELADTLVDLVALDTETLEPVTLTATECNFSYRDSLFKQQSGRYIILEIALRLSRNKPLSLDYGDLQHYFSNFRAGSVSNVGAGGMSSRRSGGFAEHPPGDAMGPLDVANGVVAIRRRKLPDPEQLPNAGSFFKNPVVPLETWERLRASYPDIAAYPADRCVKLAAGWMIDRCGWKGYRNKSVGVHSHQALVLVNHAGGSGEDVLRLARRIRDDVLETFGVELEIEPRVVPS